MKSMSYTVTKSMVTETAHRLPAYDGACRNIHGHSYRWEVTLEGAAVGENGPKQGMLLDFKLLKLRISEHIDEKFDHKLVLYVDDPLVPLLKGAGEALHGSLVIVPFVPTAEEMARYVFLEIEPILKEFGIPGLCLKRVRVWETATSCAEYSKP